MILGQGVHTITADEYHSDPAASPSLSASVASILCSQTPAHARAAHPRLNPNHVREEKAKYDTGTVAHALLLQGEDVAVVVDAADWRTNAAKEERDAARAAGQVPLLRKDWDAVQEMVAAIRAQLTEHEASPPLLTAGKPEQALVWEEDGVWCRALVDWLRDDRAAIDDLKTTSRSANPETWTRTLFGIGADIQVAFYLRGLKAVTGSSAEFRFIVAETTPPYCLSVVSLGPAALSLAEAKVDFAIKKWRECLTADYWPGYPTKVCHAELPAWEESRFLDHEEVAA